MKVKADIIRTYKSLHTWVGIISGMALFIAFYAGALTIFKEPISHWATPPFSIQSQLVYLPFLLCLAEL
ncbi:PepSY domain-containing protein [Methylophaga thalassica]|uniref:PepSY domain-containing protein n=1 Tax=Methylophaga thalassica TaxID=40223 RepID=UPI003623237A